MVKKIIIIALVSLLPFIALSAMTLSLNEEKYIYGRDDCEVHLDGCIEIGLAKEIGFPHVFGYATTDFTKGDPYGSSYKNLSQLKPALMVVDYFYCILFVGSVYILASYIVERIKVKIALKK